MYSSRMVLVSLPLEETKELQCQVEELISPCAIHVLLVSKKDGAWRMCIYFRVINNIIVKIQGQIFSRKGEVMRIKAQRIRFKCRLGQSQEQGQKKLQEAFNGLVKKFI